MAAQTPPMIFSPRRRLKARERMQGLQRQAQPPRYLLDDITEDVLERLAFLRFEPARCLIVGDWTGALAGALRARGCEVIETEPSRGFDEEQPFPLSGFDLVVSLCTLDTVNDLPGALIHIRGALASGGMMIASFAGSGSLAVLREVMFAADGDRPAARIHPLVDVRAGGQLLQRAGFVDPVVDSRPLDVGFRSLDGLIADLRAMGLSNVLADPGPPLGKAALASARRDFAARAEQGRTVERFEILTLSGWKR